MNLEMDFLQRVFCVEIYFLETTPPQDLAISGEEATFGDFFEGGEAFGRGDCFLVGGAFEIGLV